MSSSSTRPLVLLVEDSDDDAFFFSRTLNKCGVACTLKHLRDGDVAVRYLKDSISSLTRENTPRPDLVFLDLKLPTYNGFEILQWIRDQRLNPPLNVTILSGSDHRGDLERAHALGATQYCVKPVSVDQLREYLQRWQAQNSGAANGAPAQSAVSATEKSAP